MRSVTKASLAYVATQVCKFIVESVVNSSMVGSICLDFRASLFPYRSCYGFRTLLQQCDRASWWSWGEGWSGSAHDLVEPVGVFLLLHIICSWREQPGFPSLLWGWTPPVQEQCSCQDSAETCWVAGEGCCSQRVILLRCNRVLESEQNCY